MITNLEAVLTHPIYIYIYIYVGIREFRHHKLTLQSQKKKKSRKLAEIRVQKRLGANIKEIFFFFKLKDQRGESQDNGVIVIRKDGVYWKAKLKKKDVQARN